MIWNVWFQSCKEQLIFDLCLLGWAMIQKSHLIKSTIHLESTDQKNASTLFSVLRMSKIGIGWKSKVVGTILNAIEFLGFDITRLELKI